MKATLSLLILSAVLLGASPARADVTAANQKEAVAAFKALDALARQTREKGDLPRWSDPAHAKVLARVWDVKATLGSSPYRGEDVPRLLEIVDLGGAIFKAYALFTPKAGVMPDTAANTLTYQDEISRGGAYLVHAFAAQLEAANDFIASVPADQMTEPRKAGVRQMRLAVNQQITGIMMMLRSPGLRPENRAVLLDALQEKAADLTTATTLSDRTALMAQIDAVMPALSGGEQAKAKAIKAALNSKACSGLCEI